jgi:hypothetical protein
MCASHLPSHGPGRRLKPEAVSHKAEKGRKATFCEQKIAKKLCYSGPVLGFSATGPKSKTFLRRFFQKAATFL